MIVSMRVVSCPGISRGLGYLSLVSVGSPQHMGKVKSTRVQWIEYLIWRPMVMHGYIA